MGGGEDHGAWSAPYLTDAVPIIWA